MHTGKFIAKRLRELFIDGKWVTSTNYKTELEATSLADAQKSLMGRNTIAALTFHINYYLQGLNQVFEGGELTIRDKYSYDLPPLENEEAWRSLVETLLSNAEKFASHVEKMDVDQLRAPFVKEQYGNNYRNIEGVLEHSWYHFGQIAMIRKMIEYQTVE